MLNTILLVLAIAVVALLAYIRLAPMNAADWHADPAEGARTGKPNDYLVGPGGEREAIATPEAPADVMARLDAVARAEPRTSRLAGDPADGHATYLQRSGLMGYPDAISVRAIPDGDGSRLTIWSRSRFGHSDFGVNRARVERWLAVMGLDGAD